ncbi:uncharacterized protein LOC110843212 [Folsomia candida]|nr:uncharacterized protein LOC110843212 [Folsomia candida]
MGLVRFPENYELHIKNRVLQNKFADNETIAGSTILIKMDETHKIVAAWAKQTLLEKYLKFLKNIALACSIDHGILAPAIKYNAIYGSTKIFDMITYVQPSSMLFFMFMLPMGTVLQLAEDKVTGIEDREHVTGINMWHQLIAYITAQSVMIFLQMSIFLGTLCGIYGMAIHGSHIQAIVFVYLTALSGLLIGFMISKLYAHVIEILFVILFFTVSQMASSGMIYPLEILPWAERYVFQSFPVTLMVDTFRSICTRGWDITQFNVGRGFLACAFWILLSLVVSTLAERRKRKSL